MGQAPDLKIHKGGRILNVEFDKKEKSLLIGITEEIDQHMVERIRRKIDNEITRYMPRKVVLDFGNISFMDSAGIGMVLRKI